jgi:hypothetical protein
MGMNPGLEAVEDPHLEALAQETVHQVRADESRAARDQDPHRISPNGGIKLCFFLEPLKTLASVCIEVFVVERQRTANVTPKLLASNRTCYPSAELAMNLNLVPQAGRTLLADVER